MPTRGDHCWSRWKAMSPFPFKTFWSSYRTPALTVRFGRTLTLSWGEEREELAGDVERRRRKKVPAGAGAGRGEEIMLVEDWRRAIGRIADDREARRQRQIANTGAALRARADAESATAGVESRSGGEVFLIVTAELDLVGSKEQRHGAAGGIPNGFVVGCGPEDLSEPARGGRGTSLEPRSVVPNRLRV